MTYKEALDMVLLDARQTALKQARIVASEHYFDRLGEAVRIVQEQANNTVPDLETIRQWVFKKEDEIIEEEGGYDQEESWVSSGNQLQYLRLAELIREIMVTGRLP